jgi:hypothetical protein
MVVVVASQQTHMQRKAPVEREGLQEVRDHLATQAADGVAAKRQVDTGVGSTAEIDCHVRERFVEWDSRIAEPADAASFTQGLIQRLTERDADILGGVVLVHVQVAFGLEGEVETGVPREAVKHVVEKADTCGDVRPARTVQVQQYFHAAFPGLAVHARGARLRHSSVDSNGSTPGCSCVREMVRVTALPLVGSPATEEVHLTERRHAGARRLTLNAAVPYLAALALVLPLFAPAFWSGFRLAASDNVLSSIAATEQPLSVRSPAGQWAIGLALLWFALAYWRRSVHAWEVALVLIGGVAALVRAGNAWQDGLALIAPLAWQLSVFRAKPTVLAAAAAAGLIVAGATLWTTRPPVLPPGAIAAVQSARGTADVFADWRWAAELQRHTPRKVLASGGLASESAQFWLDYVRVTQDFEPWPDELRNLNVDLVVLPVEDAGIVDQIRASGEWRVVYDGDRVVVAARESH